MATPLKAVVQEALDKVNTNISRQSLPDKKPPHYFVLEELKYDNKWNFSTVFKLRILDNVDYKVYIQETWIRIEGSNEDDEIIWGILYTRLMTHIFITSFAHIKTLNDKHFKLIPNA